MSIEDGLVNGIREEIYCLAEEQYRDFQLRLLPETKNLVGVRLPKLRRMAKRIAKENGEEYLETVLCRNPDEELFEEIMLQGMVIGYMQTLFCYAEKFIPKIDNWSVCDSFCSGFKQACNYPQETWEWLLGYLDSEKEFEVRFGVVMLLNYYINEKYIKGLFAAFDHIRHDGYYVKMAVAWAVSACYVKYPKACMNYLEENNLDTFTYNKALQKIVESRCVPVDEKEKIRRMKRVLPHTEDI